MSVSDTSRTMVRAAFGGRERNFQLRLGEMSELERLCNAGIGEIMARLATHRFGVNDIWEPIRLGLEGAGSSPVEAQALVMRYHPPNYPIADFLHLASQIVTGAVSGVPEGNADAEGGSDHAPATSPSSSAPEL
ncbi:gene transfer agent family protein [Methylobacterium sp.]|uniref:gene transfer agent family protein n=1 Tax=Methylobacterium sp. TaxID=409 RepID=UPI0025F8C38B|nr:gene transfer agent family protein [Methylobacterium sp.]MBY0259598.1 gene transfer agent family protein [Methylobacterium sp.]